jgi:hypothetical protein
MVLHHTHAILMVRHRGLCWVTLVFVATTLLIPTLGAT